MKNLCFLLLCLSVVCSTQTAASTNNSVPPVAVDSSSALEVYIAPGFATITCQNPIILSAVASGGLPPYTYDWTTLTVFSAGTYSVVVTDATGATAVGTTTIQQGPDPVIKAVDVVQDLTNGGIPGSIVLSQVCGGWPPYQFLWSNGSSTQNLTGLTAGIYTVTIVDNYGCTGTLTVPVSGPGIAGGTIQVLSAPPLSCDSSCTTIQISNLPGYVFQWTGPNGFFSTSLNPTVCSPGLYTVRATSQDDVVIKIIRINQKEEDTGGILIQSSNPSFCSSNNSFSCEQVCPGATVTYTADPLANPCGPINFEWTITGAKDYSLSPDGSSATVTWAEPGGGQIKIKANDLLFCYQPAQRCITVLKEPKAKFSTTPAPAPDGVLRICKGQTVWFQNQSVNATHYEWQFSDNQATVNSEDVEHTYATAGQFQVLQIARSQCFCADSTWLDVEVLDTESPLIECVSTICPGETITYSTADNCAPYDWSVSPNGSILAGGSANDNSVTVQWLSGPDGFIGLSAPNCGASACPEPALLRVPVLSDAAKIEGPTRVCSGSEEKYSIASFEGTFYTWKLTGSGQILDGQGTREINVRWGTASSSDYRVIVNYENCYLGCSGSDTLIVKVRRPMVLTGPLELCSEASGMVQVATPLNINSQWTLFGPNGAAVWNSVTDGTFANPVFTAGPGVYRMLAIPNAAALLNTCSDSAEWKIQVAPRPAKPTGITGPAVFCPGAALSFEATGLAAQNQVQWQLKTSNAAPLAKTGNPVNVNFAAGSPRWVAAQQISSDGLGCSSDTIQHLLQTLQPLPINGPAGFCEGAIEKYSAPAHPNMDYQWTLIPANAGVIHTGQGTNEVEIYWPRAGSYTLQLSVCGQQTTLPVSVWGSPVPQPVFPAGLCAGEKGLVTSGGTFNTYDWKNENGATLSQSATANLSAGVYALQVTDNRGCQGTAEFSIKEYPLPNFTITTTDPTGFCNNSRKVVISALTTEDGDYQYEWFRDGLPFGSNQTVISTNQYGLYTATATNQYGCTATDGPILVFEFCDGNGVCHNPGHNLCVPGALGLSIAPQPQCDQFEFQLIAGPNYVPGTALWHFGESGSTFLGQETGDNPQFTFPNAGKYLVVLYGKMDNGQTCAVVDSVNVEAVAKFETARACPGDSTHFKEISTFLPQSGISSWQWGFGDPASGANKSFGRTAGHPYANAGDYTVQLTVTALSGCTSSRSEVINVPDLPVLNFTPQTTLCAGGATPLGIVKTDDLAFVQWTFGDPASGILDTSNGPAVYHRYATAGNYTATVQARNIAGCLATLSQSVDIVPNLLSGTISPAGATAVCAGKSVQLSAPPVGDSYQWSTGATDPTITVSTTGVYFVTITNAAGCSYVPPPKSVDVLPAPTGGIKAFLFNEEGQAVGIEPNALTVCAGETVHLFTSQNAAHTYKWSSGGNTTTQIFSEDRFNGLTVGTHIFTITITNSSTGCTATTAPFPVTVNPVPDGLAVTTDQNCAGKPATVSYTGPQPADWQFFWNNGEVGPSFVTTEPGHFYVRAINQFGCAANSETVTILPGPNIQALPSGCHTRCTPDTFCLPPLPDIANWQWFFNGTAIPGADGPNLVATESGVYWAELTDDSGCFAQSMPLTLELYTGTGDVYGGVWSDVNNNGLIDAGDTLVSSIAVNLWQNGSIGASGQSGAGGTFVFNQAPSVSGFVAVDSLALPNGWEIVIGESPADLVGCAATAQTQLLLRQLCAPTTATLNFSACSGSDYDFNGTAIPAGTSQDFVLQNAAGCDSVLTVNVTALSTSTGTVNVSACPGSSYDFNGTAIPAGSSQDFVLQNYLGCDSVLTVNVAALATSTGTMNVSACPGSSYDYNGTAIPAGASQDFVLQNYLGCDSVLTVSVAALATSTGTLNVSACPGSNYDFNGTAIPAGASQDFVLQNYLGCDSVLTVNVAALATSTGTLNVNACPGSSYDFNGTSILAGSSQDFVLQNAAGCDSVLTVNVAALATSTGTLNVSACPGSDYDFNGTAIPAGSAQDFVLQNYLGCDSVLTVNVAALATSTGILNVSACPGSSYDFNATLIPAGSSQDFVLQNYLGCDSVLTVNVAALATSTETLNVSACSGSSYDFNGTAIPAGSSQAFILQNYLGCDSVLTVEVSELLPTTGILHVTACSGESYDYFGTMIPAGATQEFILQNAAGCDSLLTVFVLECHAAATTLNVVVCPGESFNYNGTLIPAGSSREFFLQTTFGCDSTLLVVVSAVPAVQLTLQTEQSCAGKASGSMTVFSSSGGLGPLPFSLDGQLYQTENQFPNLPAGAYTLWTQDTAGCVNEQPFVIGEIPAPEFDLPTEVLIPCRQNAVVLQPILSGNPAGLNYLWWNGSTEQEISVSSEGPVWLELSNACATVRKTTQVYWANSPEGSELYYAPNVFQPGSERAENEVFRPYFSQDLEVLEYRLDLYDRWGSLIFRAQEAGAGWNGDSIGSKANPGVYVWMLKVRGIYCGREIDLSKTGSVTLLR